MDVGTQVLCPQPDCPQHQHAISINRVYSLLSPLTHHIPSHFLTHWFLGWLSKSLYFSMCKIPQVHIFKGTSDWLLIFHQQVSCPKLYTQNSSHICTDWKSLPQSSSKGALWTVCSNSISGLESAKELCHVLCCWALHGNSLSSSFSCKSLIVKTVKTLCTECWKGRLPAALEQRWVWFCISFSSPSNPLPTFLLIFFKIFFTFFYT